MQQNNCTWYDINIGTALADVLEHYLGVFNIKHEIFFNWLLYIYIYVTAPPIPLFYCVKRPYSRKTACFLFLLFYKINDSFRAILNKVQKKM